VSVTRKSLKTNRSSCSVPVRRASGLPMACVEPMKGEGLSEQEARSAFWAIDRNGLLHSGRTDLTPEQRVYAQLDDRVSGWPRTSNGNIGLADVIGKSRRRSLSVCRQSAARLRSQLSVRWPVRSSGQSSSRSRIPPRIGGEGRRFDSLDGGARTGGDGSPFAPVSTAAVRFRSRMQQRLHFPAMGLGVVASGARRVTEGMMLAAARALGANSPP